MEITEKDYVDLLRKKMNILNDLLILTESVDFFNEDISMDVHAENYFSLYDKRVPLLKQAVQYEEQLNSPEYELIARSKDERFIKDYKSLTSETRTITNKILELDEKNKTAAEGFMVSIKNNIKDIKVGRNVSTLYQTDVVAHGGIYFDKKN